MSTDNSPIDRRLLLGAAGLAGAAALAKLAHAGPIAPPPGPIAPTGVTLGELAARASATVQGVAEPRIPLSPQTTPGSATSLYLIIDPGSYYLTGRISSSLQHAIRIEADNVTLDLGGFRVSRSGTPGVGSGIVADGNRIIIRNGFTSGFAIGVEGANFRSHLVTEDLHASGTSSGIKLSDRSVARRCVCSGAITAIEATGDNSVISDCVVSGPGDVGIWVNSSSTVERCHVSGVNRGIVASGHANRIVACTAASNTGLGISAGSNGLVQDCLATSNSASPSAAGIGIQGDIDVAITGCRVGSNDSVGIQIIQHGFVDRCEVTSNGTAGIRVGQGSRIRNCSVSGHSSSGSAAIRLISGNSVVEDNYIQGNNIGVDALNAFGNLIIRNTMLGNTNSIAVNVGGNWYPNIPLGGVNTSTNPLNNVIG